MSLTLLSGRGLLTFDGGDLDDVPYRLEMSHLDGFQGGRIILDAQLATLLIAHTSALTLTLQDGRTLVCQLIDVDGGLISLAGGTM